MRKLVFAVLLLGSMSVATADINHVETKSETYVETVKSRYWKCPRCGTMNHVATAYCTGCGMIQR